MSTDIHKEQNWLIIISLGILALLATGFILVYASSVLIPFVLAIFIYLLISPILDFQILKLKIPRMIGVTVTLLLVMVFLAILILLISEAVQLIYTTASEYRDGFVNLAEMVLTKMKEMGLDIEVPEIRNDLKARIPKFAADTFGTTMAVTSTIIFVSIFLIFLLAGRNPHTIRTGVYGTIDSKIRRYISMKTILSLITGFSVWVVLQLFGLKLAVVFGMLTFILNYIPSIGSIIATCLPIPIAVAQFSSPMMVSLVVIIPGAIQITIGNFIEPKLMGQELKLHPVVILLALSFWGLLWGVIGMILAVPITAAIRIVLMQFETLRPVARILAGKLPGYPEESSDSEE